MITLADDPHLVERIARLAVFHDLPPPVVVQMTLMASELHRRPADAVYQEIERRIAEIRSAEPTSGQNCDLCPLHHDRS